MAHAKLNLSRMYDWIERNLDLDVPQPTDADIMQVFGFDNAESARTLLAELADAGRITIKGYGETRTIALGRTKSTLVPAPRPLPSAKKPDPAVDDGVAKIAAIVARGGNAGSARAVQAASALKNVRAKSAPFKTPAVKPVSKPPVAAPPIKEAAPVTKPSTISAPAVAPASSSSDSAPTLDGLFQMIRQHVQRVSHDQSAELAAAIKRAEAAEQRAGSAERKLEQAKALFA